MNGAPLISRCDATEVLELVDAPLDAIAQLVEPPVKRKTPRAPGVRWDDGFGAGGLDCVAEPIAVIGGVGDDGLGFLAFYQARRSDQVVNLSARQRKTQWPAKRIGKKADLGRQSSSRTPQSLVARPPFPVAAC